MMTDAELIKQWQDGEKRQALLWKEILERGLYMASIGINPDKKDNAWQNPPSITRESERAFYANVKGSPKGQYHRRRKQVRIMTEEQLAEFE